MSSPSALYFQPGFFRGSEMTQDVFQTFYTSLHDHFNAFIKGIYITLPDGVSSQRVKTDLCFYFQEIFREIITYDPYNGLSRIQPGNMDSSGSTKSSSSGERIDFLALLGRLGNQIASSKHRLLVLLDGVDSYLNDNVVSLRLAEILNRRSFGYSLTFMGFKDFPRYDPLTRLNLHEIPYPSPCKVSLCKMVRSGLEAISLEGQKSIDLDKLEAELAGSLFGCPSLAVAEDIFNLAYSEDRGFDPASVGKLQLGKIMSKIPGITIRSPSDLPSMDQVAGYSCLKSYCEMRKPVFFEQNGQIRLHGICLMGPPGTGKTLFAQALANHWQIPHCNLQMTFLSRFVGSSERNLERILRMLTDFGGPVLFHLDELSRLFGTVQADSHEVTRRIVAMLLNFLESPDSRHVYTIGTMNTLELEPALLRRFDDVFYVSLPDKSQRRELFQCFARKYKVNLPNDNSFYTLSHGMVGSEIERAVKELKIDSMSKGTEPSSLDLMRILRNRPALATLFSTLQEIEETALQAGLRLASPRTRELSDSEFRNTK
jgi:hypothetical protein